MRSCRHSQSRCSIMQVHSQQLRWSSIQAASYLRYHRPLSSQLCLLLATVRVLNQTVRAEEAARTTTVWSDGSKDSTQERNRLSTRASYRTSGLVSPKWPLCRTLSENSMAKTSRQSSLWSTRSLPIQERHETTPSRRTSHSLKATILIKAAKWVPAVALASKSSLKCKKDPKW